jgi:hypothetical protein
MLVYPSGVDVSSSALRFLAARLKEHRRGLGTRWRRLNAGRQALLTLAHLRNGQPYAQLAAGFGIGTTTAYRYITEAVNLLAALAPTLAEALWQHRRRSAFQGDDELVFCHPKRGTVYLAPTFKTALEAALAAAGIEGRCERSTT